MRAIYSEPNPGPLKYALAKAGLISTSVVRRPLIDPAPETVASLDALLDNIALLQPASR
jgi:4-hydroxy-tetrahydrodipicolinate synthase